MMICTEVKGALFLEIGNLDSRALFHILKSNFVSLGHNFFIYKKKIELNNYLGPFHCTDLRFYGTLHSVQA